MGKRQKYLYPWERQPGETETAWKAFVLYRDMLQTTGLRRRDIRWVVREIQNSDEINVCQTTVYKYSKKWCWAPRVEAYDAWMAEDTEAARVKAEEKRLAEEAKMDERLISLSYHIQRMMLEATDHMKAAEMTPKEFSDLSRALKNLADIEREARNATTAQKQLELNRERFEYEKQRDAGQNIEYEDLDSVEADIYSDGETDNDGDD
ncbi:MAG: hypothetical protein LUD72_00765 [Bacteroidales bacterium]|nr:hypothetical protein [Bacteroidales bacterium]